MPGPCWTEYLVTSTVLSANLTDERLTHGDFIGYPITCRTGDLSQHTRKPLAPAPMQGRPLQKSDANTTARAA